MPYPYAIEKIKKQRKQAENAVFFICPKNYDINKDITNFIEFQIEYLETLGIHSDIAINIEDILAKSHALGIKKFVSIKIDYLIDWDYDFTINCVFGNMDFKTAIGSDDFFCAYTDYVKNTNNIKYEFPMPGYNKLETFDILQNLKHKKYFEYNNFNYEEVIKLLKFLKTKLVFLPWEGERTLKLLEDFKKTDCRINLYHENPISINHEKVDETFEWNLYTEQSKQAIFSYFENLKANFLYSTCYFDTGCNFVDIDKSLFFPASKRSEKAQNFTAGMKKIDPSMLIGGVFPWGRQILYDVPRYQKWMHFPWNLRKF